MTFAASKCGVLIEVFFNLTFKFLLGYRIFDRVGRRPLAARAQDNS
jgi:hypothetical protein